MLLYLIPGKRTAENTDRIVEEVKERTGGRTDILITSDQYGPYEKSIEKHYGDQTQTPIKLPDDLVYATVKKTQKKQQNGR